MAFQVISQHSQKKAPVKKVSAKMGTLAAAAVMLTYRKKS